MKFRVSTSESFYSDADKGRLEAIGFKFSKHEPGSWFLESGEPKIELASLEDLTAFCEKHGGQIIISTCWPEDGLFSIEIYDGYRE